MFNIKNATDEEHQSAISLMENYLPPEAPKLGIFWYDYKNEKLFGVEKREVTEEELKSGLHTIEKQHKTFWLKWHQRAIAKDDEESIYFQQCSYTLIPKGRVFLTDGVFTVKVGKWIENGINGHDIDPVKLHDLICDEFDLPEDFVFVIDDNMQDESLL